MSAAAAGTLLSRMITRMLVLAAVAAALAAGAAQAHGGGLDDIGCHHDRTRGGYHCHRGPLAGEAFASKADALAALAARAGR